MHILSLGEKMGAHIKRIFEEMEEYHLHITCPYIFFLLNPTNHDFIHAYEPWFRCDHFFRELCHMHIRSIPSIEEAKNAREVKKL